MKKLIIIAFVMIILISACGPKTPSEGSIQTAIAQTEAAKPTNTFTAAPTNTSAPTNTNTPLPTNTPRSTNTPRPTNTPKPPDTPTPPPIGMSRSQPFPSSEVVSTPNWDIQVLEIKRGEEAWNDIHAANMFNDAAPEGMEYLLVKLHAKSKFTDNEAHSISGCDFDMTGDRLIRYTCSMASVVEPEPELDATLYSGGETEGWAAFAVTQGEGNLILILSEMLTFDNSAERFIAIDEGASITTPVELASIMPTELGRERNTPASRTDTVTTEDWEISVTEVLRDEEAWKAVQETNQYNDPPADGMEYIAVKVKARYIGMEENGQNISGAFFSSTGDAGVLYDLPSVVDPKPELDISLFPGGEFEGWVVIQSSVGETGVKLIFDQIFDFDNEQQRFISLE